MGELADQPVGVLAQAAHFKELDDPLLDVDVGFFRLPHAQAIAARHLDGDFQIFPDRQLGEHLGDLEGAGDAAPHPSRRQQPGNVLAVEDDLA